MQMYGSPRDRFSALCDLIHRTVRCLVLLILMAEASTLPFWALLGVGDPRKRRQLADSRRMFLLALACAAMVMLLTALMI